METLIQFAEADPNPSRRWLGATLIIFISSPEDMQIVLNSPHCLQKAFIYDFFNPDNDYNIGLFTARGKSYKINCMTSNNVVIHK